VRFVSVRDLRGKSAELWRDLPREGEMVVTSNGRPVAILAAVNEANVEESLAAFRRARAVDAVAALQLGSSSQGRDRITAQEIEHEIEAVRAQHHE
jgi:antitoxin (DNA-binding transcriptional repressor) of toxin-antitoxin stability system